MPRGIQWIKPIRPPTHKKSKLLYCPSLLLKAPPLRTLHPIFFSSLNLLPTPLASISLSHPERDPIEYQWSQISLSLSRSDPFIRSTFLLWFTNSLPDRMATLHEFKLLAAHCAVTSSSTRSPTASPIVARRRRCRRRHKTLRMFLREDPPDAREKEGRIRHKLKDLFVSSPEDGDQRCRDQEWQERPEVLSAVASSCPGGRLRIGSALRPVSSVLRFRSIRRAWRPVLVTIPE